MALFAGHLEGVMRESESRYRALVQDLPVAAYTCDVLGRITVFNDLALDLWGAHPEAGRDTWCHAAKLFRENGDELPFEQSAMAIALRENREVLGTRFILERQDGTRRKVLPYPVPIHDDSGILIGVVNMLVEAHHPEGGLSPAGMQEQSLQMLSLMPVAVYTCDAQGHITFFNRNAEILWGRTPRLNSPDERFCACFKAFMPDGTYIPPDRTPMAITLREGTVWRNVEAVIERPDGSRVSACVNIDPIYDEDGQVAGAINVIQDITTLKATEQALIEADHRKDEFLATLAHELRNPLVPLRNGLEIMRRAADDRETMEMARTMMERQLQQLVRLVDDLLDVSRISRGKVTLNRSRVNVVEILNSALELSQPLIESRGHTLTVELPPKPLMVEGDTARLSQVFANLLNNAAKYTDNGGRIWVRISREQNDAVITVRDNGVGITPQFLPRVFELFTQVDQSLERTHGGLGIGLSVVKQLVEMHGGSVAVNSRGANAGSEFAVRLPLAA